MLRRGRNGIYDGRVVCAMQVPRSSWIRFQGYNKPHVLGSTFRCVLNQHEYRFTLVSRAARPLRLPPLHQVRVIDLLEGEELLLPVNLASRLVLSNPPFAQQFIATGKV